MKELMQIILLGIAVVIVFAIIGLMMGNDSGSSLCGDSDNQYVSDQKWYELCK